MQAPAAQVIARLAGVAVVAMLVAAAITIGVALLADRFDRAEILIAPAEPEPIQVQVAGAVATPGVYSLPAGARVVDLVDAAGGLGRDADVGSLNLAARVGDGETIDIPAESARAVATTEDSAESSSLVDINVADLVALQSLPGIGPVLAQRIIDEREQSGPFASADDLTRIQGISTNMVDELRPLVTTGE